MDPGAAAGSSSRVGRTSLERERRMRLKDLFSQLSSLLPPQPTKMSTHQVIEQGTVYINQLRNRVEELKQIKKLKVEEEDKECREEARSGLSIITPVINIIDLNFTLELNLITGWKGEFQSSDIIKILMEEGAQVISLSANHSDGDRIIYSIHCQAMSSRIGIATSRVEERLRDLVS